jgi:hypothetical protein
MVIDRRLLDGRHLRPRYAASVIPSQNVAARHRDSRQIRVQAGGDAAAIGNELPANGEGIVGASLLRLLIIGARTARQCNEAQQQNSSRCLSFHSSAPNLRLGVRTAQRSWSRPSNRERSKEFQAPIDTKLASVARFGTQ